MAFATSLRRITKTGFAEFFRNGFVTAATVYSMSITLFIVGTLIFVHAALQETLTTIRSKVDVNVYFLTTAPEDKVLNMKRLISVLPEVSSVTYLSREDALKQFKERHKGDQLMLQAIEEIGDNPLGASISIRAKEPNQYESIVKFIEETPTLKKGEDGIVEKINYGENKIAIERLSSIIKATEKAGLAFSLFLALASILIVFNTIRLGIFTARDEIAVMRLVGASAWYTRGPFVVQGMLYGCFSGILTLILLFPIAWWLGPITQDFFGTFNVYSYYIQQLFSIAFTLVGLGIFLGALSSFLAVRRYLDV
ncbi:MAG: permease-like cell division protein FtsX [Minisyncoccia bacterium]